MTDEAIVRSEARAASRGWTLGYKASPEKTIEQVRTQLRRFYSPVHKALYLDEANHIFQEEIASHRQRCSRGPDCPGEQPIHKVLFFLKQELDQLPQIIRENTTHNTTRDTVFISYSHADKGYLNTIKRHFKPLEKRIEFWEDSKLVPGQKWKDEIKSAMSRAKVALLLVSADFFNSDFITKEEIPPLLAAAEKDGATILFLVLKPCLLDEYPEINQYQGVNAPSNPFIRMSEAEQEELCVNLATTIRDLLPIKH